MAEGVIIGKTNDGQDAILTYDQRRQGTYVIGVNGTGKTTLLRQIACSDMLQEPKHGLCVIDPHGDLIDDILALVPENRLDDVILFDPSDEENPFCLNLFAPVPAPEEIGRVASEIVAIFRKIFGGAWTPEIEGVIQNATLTLLCRPRDFPLAGKPWTPALDEIPALLAMEMVPEEDRGKPPWKRNVTTYRSQFYQLLQEQDQIPVWEFWNYSFDPLTPRPRSELTFAVLNQVRRLLANPVVRNIVGQTESKLDLSDVMNDGKILLVKLSKGLLGEANSAFLGSVIVAKLVVAVFARAAPSSEERKPFHIIVDEFQNFAISSFPTLLSEARKYGVDLVVAHQYRDQLRDWVQGATENAANTICFRLGGDDALDLARTFDAKPPEPGLEFQSVYEPYYRQQHKPSFGTQSRLVKEHLQRDLTFSLWTAKRIVMGLEQWVAKGYGESERKPWILNCLDYYFEWVSTLAGPPDRRDNPSEEDKFDYFLDQWIQVSLAGPLRGWAQGLVEARHEGIGPETRQKVIAKWLLAPDSEECRNWMSENCPPRAALESAQTALAAVEKLNARHVLYVPAEAWHYQDSQEVNRGPSLHKRAPGRPRLYSDVHQELANKLTHLPNFHALCKLSGSANPPIESLFRSSEWPTGHEDAGERADRKRNNEARVSKNTISEYTRPKAEVVAEFKARYETMLRSIGMSWTPGEPLPKPQVLYEEDD